MRSLNRISLILKMIKQSILNLGREIDDIFSSCITDKMFRNS